MAAAASLLRQLGTKSSSLRDIPLLDTIIQESNWLVTFDAEIEQLTRAQLFNLSRLIDATKYLSLSHHARGLLLVGGLGVVSYFCITGVYNIFMRRKFTQRRKCKQAEKRTAKEDFAFFLKNNAMSDEEVKKITSYSMEKLIKLLRSDMITPEETLLAYQHKAFSIDKKLNCVVEFLYPDLTKVNLDGPFAGIPVSIKDNLCIKGSESHAGLTYFLTGASKEDCTLVTVLYSLGAVPFVRTGVPQAMLSVLSTNPIDGTVLNPLALHRSPGGSSSGEAALIGAGGSILGFGTDLGGSIRLPAANCGIVGFKPTPKRISKRGTLNTKRFLMTESCIGPMARDVRSCIEALRLLCSSSLHFQMDKDVIPLPLDMLVTGRPLRIGYFSSNGSFSTAPACKRAVLFVRDKLKSIGHEMMRYFESGFVPMSERMPPPFCLSRPQLVPWTPLVNAEEWMTMFLSCLVTDAGKPLLELVKYDAVEPALAGGCKYYRAPWVVKNIKRMIAKALGQRDHLMFMNANCSIYNWVTLAEFSHSVTTFCNRIHDHWNQAGLDAVICPVYGLPAPVPVCTTKSFSCILPFLNLFNLTKMPAGTLFSGCYVTKADLEAGMLEEGIVDCPKWKETATELQVDTVGLPIGIQVAAAPWRDDLCLRVMEEIENLNGRRYQYVG